MKSTEDEVLLPPGVKSINDLNTKKVEYGNNSKNSEGNIILNNILNKNQNNENSLNKNLIPNNNSGSNSFGVPKPPDIKDSQNITTDDFFEDINNIDIEKPKNIKPYVRKRNKRDVLKIISKKITPNEQLLNNPIITTLPVNDKKSINRNDVSNNEQDNKTNIKVIPQNQMRYLNVDGTMMTTAEENIRNVIKTTHNTNKNNSTYLYNHKGIYIFYYYYYKSFIIILIIILLFYYYYGFCWNNKYNF